MSNSCEYSLIDEIESLVEHNELMSMFLFRRDFNFIIDSDLLANSLKTVLHSAADTVKTFVPMDHFEND